MRIFQIVKLNKLLLIKRIKLQNNVQQQKQTTKNANRNLNYVIKLIKNSKELIKVNIYLIKDMIETINQCE